MSNRKLVTTGEAALRQAGAVIAAQNEALEAKEATIQRKDREIASLRRRLADAERLAPQDYKVGLGL